MPTSVDDPMTTGRFVSQLLVRVPEAGDVVAEHLDDMEGVVLLHLLMADLLRFAVENFHATRTDVTRRLLDLVDDALADGDDHLINAVEVSFVEHIGASPGETPEFIGSWPAGLRAERDRQLTWRPAGVTAARPSAELDIVGELVWLPPEQGGRRAGPPTTTGGEPYRCTAFVVPHSIDDGSADFVVAVDDPGAVVSLARGAWLRPAELDGCHEVRRGDVMVLTEGRRRVAFFDIHAKL